MEQFEAKIQKEKDEQSSKQQQDQMRDLALRLEEQAAAFDKERQKTKRHTRIMICMMEFVRKMLRERLETRESELQLEVVKIQGI